MVVDNGVGGGEPGVRGEDVTNVIVSKIDFSGHTSSHPLCILGGDGVVIKSSSFSLTTSFVGPKAIRLERVNDVEVRNVDIDGGFVGVNFACGLCDGTEAPSTGFVQNSTIEDAFIGVLVANSTDAQVKGNVIRSGSSVFCPPAECGGSGLTLNPRGVQISFLPNTGTVAINNTISNVTTGVFGLYAEGLRQ